jgi:hypothetical protein
VLREIPADMIDGIPDQAGVVVAAHPCATRSRGKFVVDSYLRKPGCLPRQGGVRRPRTGGRDSA